MIDYMNIKSFYNDLIDKDYDDNYDIDIISQLEYKCKYIYTPYKFYSV
jgi:hypothetical protein